MGNKNSIRGLIKQKRNSIPVGEKVKKSEMIIGRLVSLEEFKTARSIMVYSSLKDEVGTKEIIEHCFSAGKQVSVPKIQDGSLIPCLINSFEDLGKGMFGVPEPKTIFPVEKKSIELFIVPGIAFDKAGNRIGYGYGYWDRLLSGVDKTLIIGLAFECQIVENINVEPQDRMVGKIVTEDRVIICRRKSLKKLIRRFQTS